MSKFFSLRSLDRKQIKQHDEHEVMPIDLSNCRRIGQANLVEHVKGEGYAADVIDKHQCLEVKGFPVSHDLWAQPDEE